MSRERGGIDQYDFNISFNINDRFYFGVTLGAYDVDYNKYSLYNEMYAYKWEGDGQIYEEGYSLETLTVYTVRVSTSNSVPSSGRLRILRFV